MGFSEVRTIVECMGVAPLVITGTTLAVNSRGGALEALPRGVEPMLGISHVPEQHLSCFGRQIRGMQSLNRK